MDDMAAALTRAHAHATEFLEGLDRRSVAATASLSQLRQRLGVALTADGVPAAQVIDRYTEETVAAINKDGTAFFSMGAWQGRRVMRISVVNWRTSDDDVRRTVAAVAKLLAGRRAV